MDKNGRMLAVVITRPGSAEVLELVERSIPQPATHEVLIRVRAAGLNAMDIAQRKGNYPPPPSAPQDIPGVEVSGIVEACGSAVSRWKMGDKVCALIGGGGYAEYAVADEGSCLPLPETLGFIEAASLPEAVFTVWDNVFRRGQLKAGEHFLVHGGTSGIGVTAIQLARAFGAVVYSTAGSDEKCNACLQLGADRCINYRNLDFESEFRADGIDVILDMIGGDYVSKNIQILNCDGRLVFINSKVSELIADVYQVMKTRLILTGSTLRNRDMAFKSKLAVEIEREVWPLLKSGQFKPVVFQSFSFRQAVSAHQLMESGVHIGKIILSFE